ncbi:MAG: hypothetical protein WED33_06320 [Bacteroidia bacterium]
MRKIIKNVLTSLLRPIATSIPLENWNYWLGRVYNIKLPEKVKSFIKPTTGCSANINIVMFLVLKTNHLKGDVAECGVFQGATLIPVTYMMDKSNDYRDIYGFDSFEGFEMLLRLKAKKMTLVIST